MVQLVQQKTAQMELEQQRRQVKEMTTSKKQLQDAVAELQDRLDAEMGARNDEASEFRMPIVVPGKEH
jgi:myosin protein heavy chain